MNVEELVQAIKDGIAQDAGTLRWEFCVGEQERKQDEDETEARLSQVDGLVAAVRADERQRVSSIIKRLLVEQEYTWPDDLVTDPRQAREFFCCDWCWEHALEAVLTEIGDRSWLVDDTP